MIDIIFYGRHLNHTKKGDKSDTFWGLDTVPQVASGLTLAWDWSQIILTLLGSKELPPVTPKLFHRGFWHTMNARSWVCDLYHHLASGPTLHAPRSPTCLGLHQCSWWFWMWKFYVVTSAGFTANDSGNTIWLFNIAMENPLEMDVSSWENHLFLWAMFHGYVK